MTQQSHSRYIYLRYMKIYVCHIITVQSNIIYNCQKLKVPKFPSVVGWVIIYPHNWIKYSNKIQKLPNDGEPQLHKYG